jgi:hypothetical protein
MGRLINNDSMVTTVESYHPEDGGDMFAETSVLTRATWYNIPEETFIIVTAMKTSQKTALFGPKNINRRTACFS